MLEQSERWFLVIVKDALTKRRRFAVKHIKDSIVNYHRYKDEYRQWSAKYEGYGLIKRKGGSATLWHVYRMPMQIISEVEEIQEKTDGLVWFDRYGCGEHCHIDCHPSEWKHAKGLL